MKARQAEPKVWCDRRMEAKTGPGWRLDHSERRCRKAFTLIELMVVIAVIAVIAALLVPALSQGRASAQRITCLNNLRQLALATQMYWDENADMTFRYRGAVTNNGVIWWFGWLEQWNGNNEGARAFDVTLGALYPYLQGRGVESCPALDHSFRRFKLKATGAAYGYGYNRHLSGVSTSKITRPTDLVLFVDAAQVNDFQAPASPANPMLEEFYYVSTNSFEATSHFRHRQRANAAFCDGHVDAERFLINSIDQRLPDQFVGRLHPELLHVP